MLLQTWGLTRGTRNPKCRPWEFRSGWEFHWLSSCRSLRFRAAEAMTRVSTATQDRRTRARAVRAVRRAAAVQAASAAPAAERKQARRVARARATRARAPVLR